MKVLYLNAADHEGGAAKATTRLQQGVRNLGVTAPLCVQRKTGTGTLVQGPQGTLGKLFGYARPTLEQAVLGITPARLAGPFCAAYLPDGLLTVVRHHAPDLVHLHWVARMLRLETLAKIPVPLLWTLHDSWPFTGGCYLPGDCRKYQQTCGSCPMLYSEDEQDLSRRIWHRKHEAWSRLEMTVVAPSSWMADTARSSALFRNRRIEVIPNGIDTGVFQPSDSRQARELFGLPQDKRLVLFGAKGATGDQNKGFHLLTEALRALAAQDPVPPIELVVFGTAAPAQPAELGFPCHFVGWQEDEARLARLYSCADLFVLPSIQESLGYTAMEALACGIPCVAFHQGGVPDLVEHCRTGYLARPYETADLARGIAWILEDEVRRRELALKARAKVLQEFTIEAVAQRHVALYRELTGHD